MTERAQAFSRQLLGHYDVHARSLPWRVPPHGGLAADPYRVWLSEIMLQQTRVAAVIGYFEHFTARWPDVFALAAAPAEDVMAAWAGLGYYARARNLHACAKAVVARHGGAFPADEAALRALPGIGDYTAAAIAAIAFGKPAAVVDGNVERVIARQFAMETPLPAAKAQIRAAVADLLPSARPGDFAQAMMDLGATICTPRDPACHQCPVSEGCAAGAQGNAQGYPRRAAKQAVPLRSGTAFWIEQGGELWLSHRPAHGLLGGMRGLPDDGWTARADGKGLPDGIAPDHWQRFTPPLRHVFTHFALDLTLALYRGPELDKMQIATHFGVGEWWPVDALADAGLPALFAKAGMRIMEENG